MTEPAADAAARVLERARSYVEIETPTGAAAACVRLAGRIHDDLQAAGAVRAELIEAPGAGAQVLARFESGDADAPPLFIVGHLDTVHPLGSLERRPWRVEGQRAYGPGVYDMKGPLALLVEVLGALRRDGAKPARPVNLLVTCDEETGSASSRPLIEETARGAYAALVPEPPLPDGGAKTSRKGVGIYTVRAHGRAAHAGVEPERGANAIVELARQIPIITDLADPAAGTTVNVGTIHGGTGSNVVPERADAEIDVRFPEPVEGRRVHRALASLRPHDERVRLEVEGGVNRPPLVRDDGIVALYRRVAELAGELGLPLPEGGTGGGSDGCFTAAIGVPTLDGMGLPGGGAHTDDEYIRVSAIEERYRLWSHVLRCL